MGVSITEDILKNAWSIKGKMPSFEMVMMTVWVPQNCSDTSIFWGKIRCGWRFASCNDNPQLARHCSIDIVHVDDDDDDDDDADADDDGGSGGICYHYCCSYFL